MRKNTQKWIWTITPLKKSQWSHWRLFDDYTKNILDLYYNSITDDDKSWLHIEKLKKLIQEKLAYTYVHKKTNNYKQKNTYSDKMFDEKITVNILFNVLYQSLDKNLLGEKSLWEDIVWILEKQGIVSLQELKDSVGVLPPNLQNKSPLQIQPLEDMWSTVQRIDKQKNLFSLVRNKKIDLYSLLKI